MPAARAHDPYNHGGPQAGKEQTEHEPGDADDETRLGQAMSLEVSALLHAAESNNGDDQSRERNQEGKDKSGNCQPLIARAGDGRDARAISEGLSAILRRIRLRGVLRSRSNRR